eukprot:5390459-Prymnesium_polylepis.1
MTASNPLRITQTSRKRRDSQAELRTSGHVRGITHVELRTLNHARVTAWRGNCLALEDHNGTHEMLTASADSGTGWCDFSPDKRRIACGTDGGGLAIWGEA